MLGRILALLVALPLLAGGLAGLSVHLVAEEKRDTLRQNLLKQLGEDKEALVNLTTVSLEPSAAHGTLLGFGGLLFLYAVWPRGGEKKPKSKAQSKKAGKDTIEVAISHPKIERKNLRDGTECDRGTDPPSGLFAPFSQGDRNSPQEERSHSPRGPE